MSERFVVIFQLPERLVLFFLSKQAKVPWKRGYSSGVIYVPFPKGETYYCPSNTASGASGGDGPNSRQGPLPCVGLAGSSSGLCTFLYKRDLWTYEEEEENSISLVGLMALLFN